MKNPTTLLATVRQALSCGQQEMAAYLDISRAMLSHVEKSKRSLPAQPGLKLIALYQLLQIKGTPAVHAEKLSATSKNAMHYIAKMK